MEGPSKKLKINEITSIKTEAGEVDQTLLQKMLLQLKRLSICRYMLERTEEVNKTKIQQIKKCR